MPEREELAGWSATRNRALLQRPAPHDRPSCHCKDRAPSTDDESLDALLEVLTAALSPALEGQLTQRFDTNRTACGRRNRGTAAAPARCGAAIS